MSEGDASGGGTSGGVGGDEEAAWRDLIARYEMPIEGDAASVPWPDREALPDNPAGDATGATDSTAGGAGAEGTGDGDGGSTAGADTPETRRSQAPGGGRTRVIRPATPPPAAPPEPPAPSAGLAPARYLAGADDRDEPSSDDDDPGEHFIPPPPPPLPHLDPIAKVAWTALFGGPAYLFVSTLLGWKAPGWAAFVAVAAFVGGFAVIVLRLGDRPSRGDGPDNGAVL